MAKPPLVRLACIYTVLFALAASAAQAAEPVIQQLFAFGCDSGNTCPNGYNPNTLLQSADGNFYGTTEFGGSGQTATGTVFKLSPDGQFTTVFTFVAGRNRTFPDGNTPTSLVEGNDGFLYGTTASGGAKNSGVVFRLGKDGTIKVLHSFCSLANCADTADPSGLVLANNGKFYGAAGNISGGGILFRITTGGAFDIVHAFDVNTEGPASQGMMLASDGNLYGTTIGAFSFDTVLFRLTPAGRFDALHTFIYEQFPNGGPTEGANGKLYGALDLNQDQSAPGMFGTSLSGSRLTQYTVRFMNYLTAMSDGSLWGSVTSSSDDSNGMLYSYSEKGKLLASAAFAGTNGAAPNAPLLEASDGTILGVTANGGTATGGETAHGVVFKVDAGVAPPSPSIVAFGPSHGAAGTKVVIHGAHLVGTTAVAFAGASASIQVLNTGNVIATVPQGATTGPLTLTNAGGTATSKRNFTVQ